MPDETPVPARVAANEISSDRTNDIPNRYSGIFLVRDSQFTLENQREAHKSALERQQKVIKKYGDIRSKRQAAQALRLAYPNANFRDFFRGQDQRLDDTTFDMLVALLDMGDQYPKVASEILQLMNDNQSETRGGFHRLLAKDGSGMSVDNPTPTGSGIALNTSYDAIARITDEDNDPSEVANHWGALMGIAMSGNPSEFSDEDMARVINQAIAIHEFGHALHASYGYGWYGMISKGKTGPTDKYKDSLFNALDLFFKYDINSSIDDDDLERVWNEAFEEMQDASPIKEPDQSHQRLIDVGYQVIDDVTEEEGLADFKVAEMKQKWVNEISLHWFWDGYSDDREKRLNVRKGLSKVSLYASHGATSNPNLQYVEGVAETFAAQQFGYAAQSEAVKNHIIEIMEQAQKVATQQTKRYKFDPDRFKRNFDPTPTPRSEIPLPQTCLGLGPVPPEKFADEDQINESDSDSLPTPRKLKGKALGRPIGASDDEPDDGDGDGKYTAFPGGEDNVPMPPKSLKEVVKWDNIADIINFDVFSERITDLDEDDAAYDVRQQGVDAWSMWGACRSIRKAAYRLAGLSPDTQDPNIERQGGYFGGGWEVAEDDDQITEYARFFMAELVVGARGGYSGNKRSLFRAVDVDEDESEEFEKAMSKGSIVDIPLLATADRRSQGLNEYLTRYGKDYLIEIEDGAESAEAGVFDPMWSRRDEDDTLNRIEGLAQSEQDSVDAGYYDEDEDEKKEREEQVKLLRRLVDAYEKAREQGSEKRAKAREELAEAVSDYFGGDLEGTFEDGEGLNWEGEIISEDDGSAFWDAYETGYTGEYSETQPREQITGGRFEVLEVAEDPEGVYGKIIKLRQIGVFDPQNPGLVVPKVKKD
jgi:hypothetical protein